MPRRKRKLKTSRGSDEPKMSASSAAAAESPEKKKTRRSEDSKPKSKSKCSRTKASVEAETGVDTEDSVPPLIAADEKEERKVMRLKIVLNEVHPTIWRRIEVPMDYTLWELHCAIQSAMGWQSYHLFRFNYAKEDYDDYDFAAELEPNWKTIPMTDALKDSGHFCSYEYDFGDQWTHSVYCERVLETDDSVTYPRCVGGEGNGPPEDCGGPFGFMSLLQSLEDGSIDERERDYLGEDYDPSEFDAASVEFGDPSDTLRFFSMF